MKKRMFFAAALLVAGCNFASAQDTAVASDSPVELRSKRGIPILPKAGDYSIGFSADPILFYLGNFFHGDNTTDAPGVDYPDGFSSNVLGNGSKGSAFTGKYFLDDKTAVRARFQLNFRKSTNKYVVASDESLDPQNPQFVEDKVANKVGAVLLALGLEKRRGISRVQGVYGGEILLGYNKTTNSVDYGNAMGAAHPVPTSYANAYNQIGGFPSARYTNYSFGRYLFAGVRGFAGVEYFIAPKFSIGGEFGYTLGVGSRKNDVITLQEYDATTNTINEIKVKSTNNGFTNFGIGLDNFNGTLNLNFYF